ncbi:unnamed protein product [Bemisia tabaci]|uniref:Glycosyl hydrolase family 13 catalytic domain-containing protein n=1 Tax=Bemisia tabaci TaxID=7038 RepID=A0A9P0AE01_BEMTA|nr:unnamed protein product [Bemisia tabaci]
MGIETIWIQPFYRSPMADLGYDVSDFREIDPIFGTMEHFKRLLKEIHSRVMRFWLDLGVDGFRIDAVMFLVEAAHLEDEPFYSLSKQSHSLGDSYPYPYPYPSPYGEDEYSKMNHIYTINQPETYEITHEWRVFLDEYSSKNNKTIIMCSEAYTDMGHLMKYFGFTINSRPWLPLHPDYVYKNVAAQLKESESHLKIFKRLMELRKSPIIKDGELDTCPLSKWVFMYVRKLEGHPLVLVVVNMGSETESVCAKICSDYLPDVMKVHTASVNSGYRIGKQSSLPNIHADLREKERRRSQNEDR